MNPATDHVVSTVLTTAQACGALLVAVVLAYLARLHRTPHAETWAVGFGALAVALGAVRAFIAFGGRGWWVLYLVAEWTFGVCLAAGCREFAGSGRLVARRLLAALPAAAVVAALIVRLPSDFNGLFAGQALVVAGLSAFAFAALGQAPAALRAIGWHVLRISLGSLTALFLLWVPIYGGQAARLDHPGRRRRRRSRTSSPRPARDRRDPRPLRDLTRPSRSPEAIAISRRDRGRRAPTRSRTRSTAPRSARSRRDGRARVGGGAVVMLDVDFLKPINDTEATPRATRSCAPSRGAIRALVRRGSAVSLGAGTSFSSCSVRRTRCGGGALRAARGERSLRAAGGSRVSWGAAPYAKDADSRRDRRRGRRHVRRPGRAPRGVASFHAESDPRSRAPPAPDVAPVALRDRRPGARERRVRGLGSVRRTPAVAAPPARPAGRPRLALRGPLRVRGQPHARLAGMAPRGGPPARRRARGRARLSRGPRGLRTRAGVQGAPPSGVVRARARSARP